MSAAVDPWVITQREKVKYQEQFKALQPQNGYVTGAQAKGFFLQSQLPPLTLGQIWALADTDSDGKMNINEFSIACKLIYLKLRGLEIPKALPPTLLASLSSAVGTPTMTPTGSLSPLDQLKSIASPTPMSMAAAATGVPIIPSQVAPAVAMPSLPQVMPQTGMPVAPIIPNAGIPGVMPPMMPGQPLISTNMHAAAGMPIAQQPIASMQPLITPAAGIPPRGIVPMGIPQQAGTVIPGKITSPPTADASILPAPPTPPQSNPPSRNMSISERAPSIDSPQVEWAIKGPAKLKYTQVFNSTDRTRSGYLTGVQARGILVQSKLSQAILAQIWTLSDIDCDGRLSCEEFILAMYLCDKAMSGEKIPTTLPPDWIPPSFRKVTSRHGSISGSRQGSISRHASISSQGAVDADPLAGLPQTTNLFGRGMDIERVNIVFNYDMPEDSDTYLHRVARAGRFGTKGLAITFVSDEADAKILNEVQDRFDVNITELPDEIDLSSYIEGR